MAQIILHKRDGKILNEKSFKEKIEALEDNCLHRITIENMCSPIIVEFDSEVNAMIVQMGEVMESERTKDHKVYKYKTING